MSVLERMVVLALLPGQGDLTTLRIVRELTDGVGFSDEEHMLLEFDRTDAGLKWKDAVPPKEIPIGRAAGDMIRTALRKKEKEGDLHMDELPFYERFVDDATHRKHDK